MTRDKFNRIFELYYDITRGKPQIDGCPDVVIEMTSISWSLKIEIYINGFTVGSKPDYAYFIDDESSDLDANAIEKELFAEINKLGIGPMGLGGKTTALAVKVNLYPCHIASLPVAVNIQCHASRHKVVIL